MSREKPTPPLMDKKESRIHDFQDMILPATIKFYPDYFICGNTFRSVWAIREYPTATREQALLRHLGDKDGVTLRIYARHVTSGEERKILTGAANRNRMKRTGTDLRETVAAESNLQDVEALISGMHRNREPLLHCAVYLELSAPDMEGLKLLQTEALTELVRAKINVDKLLLRQREGFQCVMPTGRNLFGRQFERVLPASSSANLYPFNYSGKTDERGFFLGRDRYGSNIIADFDKRDEDKTTGNILILGNSGQGKSYLLKLILCNFLEAGKKEYCLDPEQEYKDLTENLGGSYLDLMSGEYLINPLEPKAWTDTGQDAAADSGAPAAFRKKTVLSQHISFLRDLFRTYKDFSERQIDALEIMAEDLYAKFGLTDHTDFSRMNPEDFPIMSDLYDYIEERKAADTLPFPPVLAEDLLLGLHSMCRGAESRFFNGHTRLKKSRLVAFGVKELLQASQNLRDAMLFNILSYLCGALLTQGNTVASLDEFYLFLSNRTAVEYIRNFMKRVRKRDSNLILASQNLEDYNQEGIRELTKPLFSIPTHQFLFNAGSIDKRFYIDTLQLEDSEFELIRYPQRGSCLYKCGSERYNLLVQAPEHKARLFGSAGGR